MAQLAPSYSIRTLERERELHMTFCGLLDLDMCHEIESKLVRESKRLGADGRTFRGLSDVTEFAVQTRDVSEQMRMMHEAAPHLGMERLAVVGASVLLRQQYRRVREKLSLEFFDTKMDALNWLRAGDTLRTPNPIPA